MSEVKSTFWKQLLIVFVIVGTTSFFYVQIGGLSFLGLVKPVEAQDQSAAYNALLETARGQASSGKLEEAIKSYSKALEISEVNRTQAFAELASVHNQSGSPEKAEKFYLKSIKEDPQGWVAVALANLYESQGKQVKAGEMYEAAMQLGENLDAWMYARIGDYYASEKKLEEDREMLDKAMKDGPNEPNVQISYGNFLITGGEVDEGLTHLEKAYKLDSSLSWLPDEIARVKKEQKK